VKIFTHKLRSSEKRSFVGFRDLDLPGVGVVSRDEITDILLSNDVTSPITKIRESNGGSGSSSYVVTTTASTLFLKINTPEFESNFQSEIVGLVKISETHAFVCPTPLFHGVLNGHSFLALSYLPRLRNPTSALGPALARMHQIGQSAQFGFPVPTFCAGTPLDSEMTAEPWSLWFSRHRVGCILRLLGDAVPTGRPVATIVAKVQELLTDHDLDVTPSLVHGDFWAGNAGISDRNPCVFDPACYYGDPEVDLAMVDFFGGFPKSFFRTYETVRSISPGFEKRKRIYNMFNLLSNTFLFGGGYATEARAEIEALFE
jgi:fructosamine-3-kinase